MPDSDTGRAFVVLAFGLALGAMLIGYAVGIAVLGDGERPQCVPCSCASEPYTYPPAPFVNAPWPDPLPSPSP